MEREEILMFAFCADLVFMSLCLAIAGICKKKNEPKKANAVLNFGLVGVVLFVWIIFAIRQEQPIVEKPEMVVEYEMENEISSEMELRLAKYAKAIAEEIVDYPATVILNYFDVECERDGNIYRVSCEFSSKTAVGLRLEHELEVVCELLESENKLKATEVYLDRNKIM